MINKQSAIKISYAILAVFLALIFVQAKPISAQETAATTTDPNSLLGEGIEVQNQQNQFTQTVGRSRYGDYQKALVKNVITESVDTAAGTKQNTRYTIEILNGSYKNQTFSVTQDAEEVTRFNPTIGDKIIVFIQNDGDPNQPTFFLETNDRSSVYILGIVLLILLLIGLFGSKSIKIALALFLAIFATAQIALPLYLKGWPILLSCSIGFLPVGIILIYLALGWNKKSHTAAIAYFIGLLTNCIFLQIIFNWAKLGDASDSPVSTFFSNNPQINAGLVILIGAMAGLFVILQHISCIISANTALAKQNNPTMDLKKLFIHGMNVGQKLIQTNIIIYPTIWIGASITTIIIKYQEQLSWNFLINQNLIAQILVPPLFATIGLLVYIPIISLTSSLAWTRKNKSLVKVKSPSTWRSLSEQDRDQKDYLE